MLWCNVMNMWCVNMGGDDYAMACCDGRCMACEECVEVAEDNVDD